MEWLQIVSIIEGLALMACMVLLYKAGSRILIKNKEDREHFVEELNGRPTRLDSAINKLSEKVQQE